MTKGSPRPRKLPPAEQQGTAPERIGTPPPSPLPEFPEPADEAMALESAKYIAQMAAELAAIARGSHLDLLAYFLDMARVEANSSMRKLEGTPE